MNETTGCVLCVACICGLLAVACWVSGSALPVLVLLFVFFVLLL